jgi:hypothetical protein
MKRGSKERFRVVLDTNVYLSAFLFQDNKFADVWRLCCVIFRQARLDKLRTELGG